MTNTQARRNARRCRYMMRFPDHWEIELKQSGDNWEWALRYRGTLLRPVYRRGYIACHEGEVFTGACELPQDAVDALMARITEEKNFR